MTEPRQIGARFDVEGVAGSGGLGVVYRCRDRATGGLAAVKVAPRASAKQRERFMREAEMLSTVGHPNVVRYLAHGLLDEGEPYLAMEWLEGEDLHARLERAPLSLTESVVLARRIASALAAAHAVGIVHRDVKPANIFLMGKDPTKPKLLDFGIARAGAQNMTQPGGVMGTPGYMAPEQARGESLIDARADVFSLGCVLYECVSGRRAFDGDSPMAILAKVLLEDPPPLRKLRSDVPAALEHTVARALAKSKESRYASAEDVARDLDRLDASSDDDTIEPAMPAGALTTRERKLLCLLLARRGQAANKDATLVDDAPGPSSPNEQDHVQSVRELTGSLGTNAEVLLDGSLVVVIEGTAAVDQAARAARAALRLRELGRAKQMPMRLAIATGRGEIVSTAHAAGAERGSMPVGEVVDRACALLDSAAPDEGIRVDPLTSNLIEGRFRVTADEHGTVLLGELESEGVRSMLGRKTECIGREREIGTLLALYAEVKDEAVPRLALITGDAGSGKSRLKIELVDRLEEDAPLWLFGGGDVAQPGAPFGAMQVALRRELSLRAELSPEERRVRALSRLSRTMGPADAERVAPFLAQLAGLPLDDAPDSRVEAARADAMVMGDALRAAWQDFLEAEGRKRPIVLALEDMQWGDRPSMNLALAATKALKSTPLLVLVTGRPDIFSVFGDLVTTRGLTHVELGPLGKRASIRLLQNLLEDKSAESVERVAQQAGGNPFLLEELARAVAQGRGKELPETVLATAQARLETLSPSLRRVLRAAAVLGDSITEEGVGALLVDLGADERRERLRELVHEEILESDPSEPGRYWFHQVVLREASYASLTEADKKLAHALAAQWLTARGGADPLTLATHHERADQRLEAIEYLLASAEQSLEGQDFEGALVRVTRAASAGAEGPRLGRIWLLRSEANRWLGKTEQMRECSVQAARLLPEGNRLWLAAKANEAHAAMQLGDTKPAESLAVLLALLVEGGDKTAQVISAAARVAANLVRYRVTAPATRLLGALSIAVQGCTDEGAVGRVWEALATDAAFRNEAEDALELYESAYQNFTRANDVRSACTTRLNQAYSLMQVGQSARASTLLREMLALAERNGLATLRSLALHNLGMALAEEGHLVEGEQVEREAWRMYVEQKSKRLTAACRYYLGRILMMRGMHADAEAEMTHACADAEGLPSLVPLMLAGLALAQLAAGKRVEALATARDAERRTTEREGRVESPESVKLALAEALAANDQRADAAKVLRQLTSELEIQSQRLRDPELRRSFLENAPDNARAFALQAKLDGTPAR